MKFKLCQYQKDLDGIISVTGKNLQYGFRLTKIESQELIDLPEHFAPLQWANILGIYG